MGEWIVGRKNRSRETTGGGRGVIFPELRRRLPWFDLGAPAYGPPDAIPAGTGLRFAEVILSRV